MRIKTLNQKERLLKVYVFIKYLIAAVILIVPLTQKFPLLKVSGTFVAIRLEDFTLLIGSFLIFLIYIRKPGSFFGNTFYRIYFIYLAIGLVSYLNGVFVIKTLDPKLGMLHLIRRFEYFVPFILGYEIIQKNKGVLNYYLKLLMVVLTITFIYGFGQRYFSWPIIVTQNQEYSQGVALKYVAGSHINSTFAGHYDLASFLVLTVPVILLAMILYKNKLLKLGLLAIYLSCLWLVVASASRISFVALLISESLALLFVRKYKLIPVFAVITVVFIMFSTNLISRYASFFDVYKKDFKKIVTIVSLDVSAAAEENNFKRILPSPTPTPLPPVEDRSTSIRLNVEWPRALRSFYKNPLLGTGFSSIDLATDNDYLRLIGEIGFLGFYSFFLFWIYTVAFFIKRARKIIKISDLTAKSFVGGIMGAIPAIFLNAVFIDIFEASKFAIMFWLFLGFAVSSVVINDNA